jgi:hypothetical protein
MFVHHVYFWLKNADSDNDKQQLLQGLHSLMAIEPKQLAHIGVPAETNRGVIDTSYTFSLLLIFNTLQEQEDYQVHPIHLQFVENCAPLWERVVVYDSVDIS